MRILFVTGKLAEPALRRVLAEMAPPFDYEVAPLGNPLTLRATPVLRPAMRLTSTWVHVY